jgi:hypothetical protein
MVGDGPMRVVQRRVWVTNSQAGNIPSPRILPSTRKAAHNQVLPPLVHFIAPAASVRLGCTSLHSWSTAAGNGISIALAEEF